MNTKIIETKAREQKANICGVDAMAINMFAECMVSDKTASINMPDNFKYKAKSKTVDNLLMINISKNNKPFCIVMYSFHNESYYIDFVKEVQ